MAETQQVTTFKLGDVVRLKSGGPDMTITREGDDGTWHCTWFGEDHDHPPHCHAFQANAIAPKELGQKR